MARYEKYVTELRKKISRVRRAFSKERRKAYFGQNDEFDLRYCAFATQNPEVLRTLAFHSEERVKIAVACNQNTSYETLLYLLNDRFSDVRRAVMIFGRLEEEDFIALAERFHDERSYHWKLDADSYVQIIKLRGSLASWTASQSRCLLLNKHNNVKGIRSIKLEKFSPWREGALRFLKEVKKERILEAKSVPVHTDWSVIKGKHPQQVRRLLPRLTATELRTGKKIERLLINNGATENAKISKEALGAQPGSFLKLDRQLAASDSTSYEYLNELLKSPDNQTRRLVLANPAMNLSDLKKLFVYFPSYVMENPKFSEFLISNPNFLKKLSDKDREKILKSDNDCPSVVADSLINDYRELLARPIR